MEEELVSAEKHKEISIIQLAKKPVYAKVFKLIMNHKIELENMEILTIPYWYPKYLKEKAEEIVNKLDF